MNQFQQQYEQSLGRISSSDLREFKKEAYTQFKAKGWPTRKDEDWHYTSTKLLSHGQFAVAKAPEEQVFPEDFIREVRAKTESMTTYLVFVDGYLAPTLSALPNDAQLTVTPITEAFGGKSLASLAGLRSERTDKHSLYHLQHALLDKGCAIKIPDNIVIDVPINIVWAYSQQASPTAYFPFNRIFIGKNSSVTFLESSVSEPADKRFCSKMTDISADENSQVRWSSLFDGCPVGMQLALTDIRLQRDSQFHMLVSSLDNMWLRHELNVRLQGEGAHFGVKGVYITADSQHHDHKINLFHEVAHTTSQQHFKGLLFDHGKAVFDGKIVVQRNALQINAQQLNNTLLMSDNAEINSKPQLEIDADDVKCSHGATVGQLQDEELFYLQSRGITKKEASAMLCRGFLERLFLDVNHGDLHREQIKQRLQQVLHGEAL